MDAMDDRGRVAHRLRTWRSPEAALRDAAATYRSDWWVGADPMVEVWAEKDAVSGILEPLAFEYGLPYLACRGFASLTALWEASQRLARYAGQDPPTSSTFQNGARLLARAQRAPCFAGDQQAGHASSSTKEWQNAERDDGGPVGPVPPTAAHNECCQ